MTEQEFLYLVKMKDRLYREARRIDKKLGSCIGETYGGLQIYSFNKFLEHAEAFGKEIEYSPMETSGWDMEAYFYLDDLKVLCLINSAEYPNQEERVHV